MISLRVLGATVALLASASLDPVAAQSARVELGIRAVVPKFCTVKGSVGPIEVPIVIKTDAAGIAVASSQPITIGGVVCNAPADMVATSVGGSARSTATATALEGVADQVGYSAAVRFGSAAATLVAGGAAAAKPAASAHTTNAINGQVVVTITPAASSAPLAPSSVYRDVVRIRLAPR